MAKGYKIIPHDWVALNKKYSCPGEFKEDLMPIPCQQGMHFCEKLVDCLIYYPMDLSSHVVEVKACGAVRKSGNKSCTNHLKIIREIPWAEVFRLINIGVDNLGTRNTGNGNVGSCNAGGQNYGSHNTGMKNLGNFNSGLSNCGHKNTGVYNFGDSNTGACNNGDKNTGNNNIGCNNTGDFNKTNNCSGCFCTEEETIRLFNKPSNWTLKDWRRSWAYNILRGMPTNDVNFTPEYRISTEDRLVDYTIDYVGGKLSASIVQSNEPQEWWDNLDTDSKSIILSIPNFDAEIFKQITGIDINKNL